MENAVLHSLITRRSVRRYKPDPVPQELLDQVMEAGLYAASGMGRQGSVILQVTDKALRDRLMRLNAAVMGCEDTDPFYGAPALLIVLSDRQYSTYLYDGSLVMGNMMNAAHALDPPRPRGVRFPGGQGAPAHARYQGRLRRHRKPDCRVSRRRDSRSKAPPRGAGVLRKVRSAPCTVS